MRLLSLWPGRPLGHLTSGLSCLSSGSHCPQLESTVVHSSAEHAAILQVRGGSESDPSQGPHPSGWLHHHLPLPGVWKPTGKWRPFFPAPPSHSLDHPFPGLLAKGGMSHGKSRVTEKPRLKSWLHHIPGTWPWAGNWTSLSLSSSSINLDNVMTPDCCSQLWWRSWR